MQNDADKPTEAGGGISEAPPAAAADAAAALRGCFAAEGVFALELVASPHAGKTSTILSTIDALRDEFNIAVVLGGEGDASGLERIESQGIPAVRLGVQDSKALDASELQSALVAFDLSRLDLVIVEEVAALGAVPRCETWANAKALLSSVPEGDDMPVRYPVAFGAADIIVLNKADRIDAHGFEYARFEEGVRACNPDAPIFRIAATTGEGIDAWADWLAERVRSL